MKPTFSGQDALPLWTREDWMSCCCEVLNKDILGRFQEHLAAQMQYIFCYLSANLQLSHRRYTSSYISWSQRCIKEEKKLRISDINFILDSNMTGFGSEGNSFTWLMLQWWTPSQTLSSIWGWRCERRCPPHRSSWTETERCRSKPSPSRPAALSGTAPGGNWKRQTGFSFRSYNIYTIRINH